MKNTWRRTAVRLMAGWSLALLAACGGGGGGGNPAPAPSPTPQGTGLVPAAPALGASLLSDASTLRPARDQSVWTYRQRTERFNASGQLIGDETVTQTVRQRTRAEGGFVERTEWLGRNPEETALLVDGQSVRTIDSIPLGTGKSPERIELIELRSPLRAGDRYVSYDRRIADAGDLDGDARTDSLDLAIYSDVIGEELIDLPLVQGLKTYRVDTWLRTRATLSRTGTTGPVVELRISTWYAAGIGIVQQRTEETLDRGEREVETTRLEAFDGGVSGYGLVRLSASDAFQDPNGRNANAQEPVHQWPRADHTLWVFRGGSSPLGRGSWLLRTDARGQRLSSEFSDLSVFEDGGWADAGDALFHVQAGLNCGLTLRRFDPDGRNGQVLAQYVMPAAVGSSECTGLKLLAEGSRLVLTWASYGSPGRKVWVQVFDRQLQPLSAPLSLFEEQDGQPTPGLADFSTAAGRTVLSIRFPSYSDAGHVELWQLNTDTTTGPSVALQVRKQRMGGLDRLVTGPKSIWVQGGPMHFDFSPRTHSALAELDATSFAPLISNASGPWDRYETIRFAWPERLNFTPSLARHRDGLLWIEQGTGPWVPNDLYVHEQIGVMRFAPGIAPGAQTTPRTMRLLGVSPLGTPVVFDDRIVFYKQPLSGTGPTEVSVLWLRGLE